MAKETKFLVVKNKDEKEIKYFEYDKIKGYNIKPRNNIKFTDAINVNKMILINPSLIEKLIEKKSKRKLNYLINLMSNVLDSDNDDGNDSLYIVLDEVEKFKREIINKYRSYLDEEKYNLMLKKIAIVEDELNLRIKYLSLDEYENKKEGKSR